MIEQKIADFLILSEKRNKDNVSYLLNSGTKISIPLISNTAEEFLLDIHKHQINLYKYTFQNRARKSIGLVRVDFDGPPHKNPDGSLINTPHMHLYKEGYDLKWAYPLPFSALDKTYVFSNNFGANLESFFKFCNITQPPIIQMSFL